MDCTLWTVTVLGNLVRCPSPPLTLPPLTIQCDLEVLRNCGVGFSEADSLKILNKTDVNAMEIKFSFQDFLAYYLRLPKTGTGL